MPRDGVQDQMGQCSRMKWGKSKGVEQARGFLSRLARDTRGNTIAILAASLIPLAGMVGGGIDISRMYILKTRMQHACDAGALAGRRTMGGGTWSFNSNYAEKQANKFFDGNFNWDTTTKKGPFESANITRTFTEQAGKVTGNAQATIPMTLMRIFGRTTETLSVTCDAEMRLPNTDVMFVLDVTGSMAEMQPGDTVNKMSALKTAVKCFYEIVARLNTNATCTTGTPGGGTGSEVQIRFGFVPYATNVNVGKLLKPEWFADSWKYQTREAVFTTQPGQWTWTQVSATVLSSNSMSLTGVPQNMCNDATAEAYGYNPQTAYVYSNGGKTRQFDKTLTTVNNWTANNGGTCSATQVKTRYVENNVQAQQQVFQQWHYAQLPVNVGLLKSGGAWKTDYQFQWPVAANGTNKTITWDGCVEERTTVRQTNYIPVPSGAKDLDIDTVPSDDSTKWGMVLPGLIYTRNGNQGNWNLNEAWTTAEYGNSSAYSCPWEARKLQQWPVADDFDDYVDQLQPTSNTYHDIGLIWGARLMSPTGLFKSENEYTPRGGEIERHMIFMTDGDACTENHNYTAYGVAWFDRRQTSTGSVPTDGCTSTGTLTQQVNYRTEAMCSAIKNKNITLWVIAFGNLATSTETRLNNCATPGKYFKATNAAQLQQTFKTIADQISMLRLTN